MTERHREKINQHRQTSAKTNVVSIKLWPCTGHRSSLEFKRLIIVIRVRRLRTVLPRPQSNFELTAIFVFGRRFLLGAWQDLKPRTVTTIPKIRLRAKSSRRKSWD